MTSNRTLTRVAVPALAGCAALGLLVFSTLAALAQQQDGSYSFPIQVTSVNMMTSGQQVSVDVQGIIGDGCSRFGQTVQWREGSRIMVRVLGRHSGDQICTMIAQLYHDTTILDGPLPAGDYTVDVNGTTQPLHIDGTSAAPSGDGTGAVPSGDATGSAASDG
ncbi:MAG: hypothetical protein QOF51_2460 [Chloroflexota bacterium]|jgi:hypothetical protein|nr:hypothetical protein [Chloroflexota bacterium]